MLHKDTADSLLSAQEKKRLSRTGDSVGRPHKAFAGQLWTKL